MPEQLYRIGDAARLLDLKPYVLRYWETEFSQIRPVRSGKGQRRYTESDMATLRRIKYLLHEQGMTIEGARKVLAGASSLSMTEDPAAAFLKTGSEPVATTALPEAAAPATSPEAIERTSGRDAPPSSLPLSLEFASGSASGSATGPATSSAPDGPEAASSSEPGKSGVFKERLVQLSLVDFVIPRQIDPKAMEGTPVAEAPVPAEAGRKPEAAEQADSVDPVADEARLKRITDELRALQSLLRRG